MEAGAALVTPGLRPPPLICFIYAWNHFLYRVILTGRQARFDGVVALPGLTEQLEQDHHATTETYILLKAWPVGPNG